MSIGFFQSLTVCLLLLFAQCAAVSASSDKAEQVPSQLTAKLRKALMTNKMTEVKVVSDMPAKVQAAFGKGEDRLASANEDFCSGCVRTAGKPYQRLLFASPLSDNLYAVAYESGGYVNANHLKIYDLSGDNASIVFQQGFGPFESPASLKEWAKKQTVKD